MAQLTLTMMLKVSFLSLEFRCLAADPKGFVTIVVNYGTDIPNLKGNHKRYLYGPGDILVAHSDHEHLKISDLETAVEGYKTLVRASLKQKDK